MKLLLLLIITIPLAGCVRPGDHPISSNCTWSEDDSRSLDLARISDRRHLRFDAVTAEDMAIRWADKNFGHLPEWEQRCDRCMETLFAGVAKQHGVDVATVSQYSRDRDPVADAAVIVGFGILYVLAAYILAGRVRRQFAPDEPGFWVMTFTLAVGLSLVGVVGGSLWAIAFESLRLNSAHISFRMNRIPFRHHWAMLLICGFVVFWLVALVSRKRVAKTISNPVRYPQITQIDL